MQTPPKEKQRLNCGKTIKIRKSTNNEKKAFPFRNLEPQPPCDKWLEKHEIVWPSYFCVNPEEKSKWYHCSMFTIKAIELYFHYRCVVLLCSFVQTLYRVVKSTFIWFSDVCCLICLDERFCGTDIDAIFNAKRYEKKIVWFILRHFALVLLIDHFRFTWM